MDKSDASLLYEIRWGQTSTVLHSTSCVWVGGSPDTKCNLYEDSQRVARRPAENVAVRGCYAVAIVAILQPVPLSGYSLN